MFLGLRALALRLQRMNSGDHYRAGPIGKLSASETGTTLGKA